MIQKYKTIIARVLLSTLLISRVLFAVPAFAQVDVPAVPTVPPVQNSAPAAPAIPTVPPVGSVPTVNQSQPTSPVVPTVPPPGTSAPTTAPTGTTDSQTGNSSGTPSPTTGETSDSTGTSGASGASGTEGVSGTSGSEGPTGSSSGSGSDYSTQSSGNVNDPANIGTGAYSTNVATETLDEKMAILNKNLAELDNKISQISSTGFNYANLNTMDGQVFTGDSNNSLNLINKLNSNLTGAGAFAVFNVYNTYLGDLVFNMGSNNVTNSFGASTPTISKNVGTGAFSTNIADSSNAFTINEANGNDANLSNNIVLESNTGGNSASYNTGNGLIKTGNATAVGNIVNLANTNINATEYLFAVVNIFGNLIGDIILPQDTSTIADSTATGGLLVENSDTGAFSTNEASYTNTDTVTETTNNTADINSTLEVTANTGGNSASMNTGGGAVMTGSTETAVSNSTIANVNTDQPDDTVWMVLVNNMGNWTGQILGSAWGDTAASNVVPITQTVSDGSGSQSFNTSTGAFSNNTADITNTSNTTVDTQNTADINNTITVASDTGNNSASTNTGAGVIQTGDAKAGLNLVNIANTNITAKKVMILLVNVIGDFLGDVVTPESNYVATGVTPTPTHIPSSTGNTVTPTGTVPSPTPTTSQVPVFTASTDSGSLGSTDSYTVTSTNDSSNGTNTVAYDYSSSYAQVYYQQQSVKAKAKTLANQNALQTAQMETNANAIRGIFISRAFATAGEESSIAAILLSGFKWKVNETWLSILPIAILILLLRRRRSIQLGKYIARININSLLEVIL